MTKKSTLVLGKPYWTFGMMVRAMRHGFYPLPGRRKGIMRIRDVPGGWLCELRPYGLVPNAAKAPEFYLWWKTEHGIPLIESSSALRVIREVKQPFSLIIGEDGESIRTDRRKAIEHE